MTQSFPLMKDLPDAIESADLSWEQFKPPGHHSTFWLGKDHLGRKWLTKLRGPRYAYREIAFARIAQEIGWYCQSSVFLKLNARDVRLMGATDEQVHSAHWFMKEHPVSDPCSSGCRLGPLLGKPIESVDDLRGIAIDHILNRPKSEFASCLFGGNEPPGHLFAEDTSWSSSTQSRCFLPRPPLCRERSGGDLPADAAWQTRFSLTLLVSTMHCAAPPASSFRLWRGTPRSHEMATKSPDGMFFSPSNPNRGVDLGSRNCVGT